MPNSRPPVSPGSRTAGPRWPASELDRCAPNGYRAGEGGIVVAHQNTRPARPITATHNPANSTIGSRSRRRASGELARHHTAATTHPMIPVVRIATARSPAPSWSTARASPMPSHDVTTIGRPSRTVNGRRTPPPTGDTPHPGRGARHRRRDGARSVGTVRRSLARPAGFEPATHRLEVCRSVQLSYGRIRRPPR